MTTLHSNIKNARCTSRLRKVRPQKVRRRKVRPRKARPRKARPRKAPDTKGTGYERSAPQRQNTEISKQIIPRKGISGSQSQFPHSCVCERFIYSHHRCACWRKYVDRSWDYINRLQTHECGNWSWGRALPRKGIHIWDFRCSAATKVRDIKRPDTKIYDSV